MKVSNFWILIIRGHPVERCGISQWRLNLSTQWSGYVARYKTTLLEKRNILVSSRKAVFNVLMWQFN